MRKGIWVLVLFIIILIMFAGCTSEQSGAGKSKNQKSATGNDIIKTTLAVPSDTSSECQPADPIRFQKFLPTLPGYDKLRSPNNSVIYTFHETSKTYIYTLSEVYRISDKSNADKISVSFSDMGPCVTELNGVDASFSRFKVGTDPVSKRTTTKIDNFHGYPAIHQIQLSGDEIYDDQVWVRINNQLSVEIEVLSPDIPRSSLSEAESEIEKFANAIDFNGLAASV
jgi:hypothetical protein